MFTDTYKFLSLFRKEDEKVIIALYHDGNEKLKDKNYKSFPIHLEMKMSDLEKPLYNWVGYRGKSKYYINSYNKKHGFGVFFIPNVGGTKNSEINDIRAWFVDIDFAKVKEIYEDPIEAKSKVKELEETEEFLFVNITEEEKTVKGEKVKIYIVRAVYKQEPIKKKKESYRKKNEKLLRDAIIVESFSGFHIYWIAKNASVKNWRKIEEALIELFEADNQVKKEANLLRINDFMHQKYDEAFEVKVVQWSDKTFTEDEFIKNMNLFSVKKQEKGFAKEEVQKKVSFSSELTRSVTVIRKKQESNLVIRPMFPFGKLEEQSFNEALQSVLSEPISEFIHSPELEVGENILCPFHNDHKPSASVYLSKNGQMVFHCNACSIGTRNVIGLYMAHTGKGWRKSVEDLAKLIGIKVVETEFEREQFRKYRDNRQYLEQDLETLVENTAFFINKYGRRSYLRFFNDKAETNVLKESFQYKNHNVFFVSYRAISEEMHKKSMLTVQNTVVLMNTLGFIERVPEQFIPLELKERAEKEREILQNEFRQQGEKGEKESRCCSLN